MLTRRKLQRTTYRLAGLMLLPMAGGCGHGISPARQADRRAVQAVYRILDAERRHKSELGRYASGDELAASRILEESFWRDLRESGFIFRIEADGAQRFRVYARPVVAGETGLRQFRADETGAVYETYQEGPPEAVKWRER